jgi:hypothetical protein
VVATPHWLTGLTVAADVLAAADEAGTEAWRSGPGDDSVPPLTVRLGALGGAFAAHALSLPPRQRRTVLGRLEDVLRDGDPYERDAVATGFFEALLHAWDAGVDLRAVWPELGPRSRAYCRAWNDFTGVRTPRWMAGTTGS